MNKVQVLSSWVTLVFMMKLCVDDAMSYKTTNADYVNNCVWENCSQTCSLVCTVSRNDILKFTDIQRSIENSNNSNVSVSITCQSGGTLSLRHPIKGKQVTQLFIRSCRIHHMYDYDLSNANLNKPYGLRTMEMIDCLIVVTSKEINKILENWQEIHKKCPCYITPPLERYVERNVSIKSENVSETSGSSQYYALQSQCLYSNLIYYEKSFSENANTYIQSFFDKAQQLPKLEILNLTHSGLLSVPYKWRWSATFPSLLFMDVSHNSISKFPSHSKARIYIDMSNNKMTVLSKTELFDITKNEYGFVIIKDNRFLCNCDMKDMLDFIRNGAGITGTAYSYLNDLKCDLPLLYRGRRISELTAHELCPTDCSKEEAPGNHYIIYVSLGVLALCFVVFLVLIRFRKELKILAFTRLGGIFSVQSVQVSSDDKDFDAFISYSSLDEKWVLYMCKRLEESTQRFNLCLHHKNFVPGACIADNIIQSVEKSRHTILVLSNNFLQSDWCILEFRKAFHQNLIERNQHLIVLMLDNLEESHLEHDMKYFLQTYTYLKVSERLFWDKLIYILSDRNKSSSNRVSSRNAESRTQI